MIAAESLSRTETLAAHVGVGVVEVKKVLFNGMSGIGRSEQRAMSALESTSMTSPDGGRGTQGVCSMSKTMSMVQCRDGWK